MLQRCEAIFSGRVQGVGFRYTTKSIAANHEVVGYVTNLPDGRVRMEAEGDRVELDDFLQALMRRMSDYIRDAAVDYRPSIGEFTTFEIRR